MSWFWSFLFLCVICGTVCRVMVTKVQAKEENRYGNDDTLMIQEIHRGLQRMEERVEALETLLMDRVRHYPERSEF